MNNLDFIRCPKFRIGTIIYIGLCLGASFPLIEGVVGILYANSLPSGADPAHHTAFILRMIFTKNVLIPYTQFIGISQNPNAIFYPSLLHILIASLVIISSIQVDALTVTSFLRAVMLVQYFVGIIGFSVLLKMIIDRTGLRNSANSLQSGRIRTGIIYYGLLFFAFALFIYSTSPTIKTLRDGGYGEIFAMWCIFPFYLYFLTNNRWIVAAVLLAVIMASHNLGFIMSIVATVSYFASLILTKEFAILKKAWLFITLFTILSLPALTYFYIPVITLTSKGANVASV